MNCKPGDLAVIVRSESGLHGRIVKCVRLHNSETHDVDGVMFEHMGIGPRWVIETPIPMVWRGRNFLLFSVADVNLHPIRDQDGEDEMLRIAGKPKAKERA